MKTLTPEQVLDITEVVYRIRLEDDCPTNVRRMLEKDSEADPDDNGKKLRNRSKAYRGAVEATLQAIGMIEASPRFRELIKEGLAGPAIPQREGKPQ